MSELSVSLLAGMCAVLGARKLLSLAPGDDAMT